MLYTGRDRAGRGRLGMASSPDGVRWVRLAALGDGADPTVEELPDGGRVWFTSGPGQIGVAMLRGAVPSR